MIETGGGFSTYYPRPSWQNDQVNAYFSAVSSSPPASGYNSLGRGYPDVSLVGVAYEVIIRGQLFSIYGTSASAPVLAGMVSLVNAIKYNQSKPSIGK